MNDQYARYEMALLFPKRDYCFIDFEEAGIRQYPSYIANIGSDDFTALTPHCARHNYCGEDALEKPTVKEYLVIADIFQLKKWKPLKR